MRADTLHGEVGGGGVALEISSFVGPCEIARADRRVLFGAQKTVDCSAIGGNASHLVTLFLGVSRVHKIFLYSFVPFSIAETFFYFLVEINSPLSTNGLRL
jgi:hypothetical protein